MVRSAPPTIGTNSTESAATAAGVKEMPTEEATIICPIGRVTGGTRTSRSDRRRAVAKAIAPIIQGSGRLIRLPTAPQTSAPA